MSAPTDYEAEPLPADSSSSQADGEIPAAPALLKRAEHSGRLLPPIIPDLYAASISVPETDDAGQRLLALAARPLPFGKRVLGLGLSADERIGRIIWLHAQGFACECGGQEQRADYYWQRAAAELRTLWSARGRQSVAECEQDLRDRLLEELFIDTHCAFYNGYVLRDRAAPPDGRAFKHATWIITLTKIQGGGLERYADLLGPIYAARAAAYEVNKQPQLAAVTLEELCKLYPERFDLADQMVRAYLRAALSEIDDKTTAAACQINARILEREIIVMEKRRQLAPDLLSYYGALSILCHLRAVKLGHALTPAAGLAAVQKALTYDPDNGQARTTYNELLELLERLRNQIREVEAQVARNPRAQMSAEGQRVRTDISRGVSLAQEYAASQEAAQLAEARDSARARHLWRRVGVPAPEQDLIARTDVLVTALKAMLQIEPCSERTAARQWGELAAASPDLAAIDPLPLLDFASRRRSGLPDRIDLPGPDFLSPADPLVLEPAPRAQRQHGEPLDLWLFSRQNIGLKLLALGAALLLALAGALTLIDGLHTTTRARAYEQVVAAATVGDYLGMMDAASQFLRARPLSGEDPRADQVRDLYAEAFVRWFASLDEAEARAAQGQVEQYRTLMAGAQ